MQTGALDADALQRRLENWRPQRSPRDIVIDASASPDAALIVGASGEITLADRQDKSKEAESFGISVVIPADAAWFGDAQFDAAVCATALVQDRFDLPVSAVRLSGNWPRDTFPRLANAIRAKRHAFSKGSSKEDTSMDTRSPQQLGSRDAGLDPATLASLRPHVFDLWDGKFSTGGIYQTSPADVDRVFDEALPQRLASLPQGQVLPVVLYAHGGLDSESTGLQIATTQVPWWNANGCYPIQFVWETGLLESIEKIIGVQRGLSRDLSDISDAIIERAARQLGGPEIWGNMKNAAAAAFEPGAAGTMVVQRLAAFARQNSDRVRLHAVGHSAGAIFHAHMLQRLDALDAPALETLQFMAPAITVDAYLRLADPLVPRRAKQLRVFTMKKDYELRDTVTPLYRKSLLYLIRNALEPQDGEPVLGLEESLRGNATLVDRFGLASKPSMTASVIWSVTAEKSGSQASASISHGGFDDDVLTMNSVARAILGIADTIPLPLSFPAGTGQRNAFTPPASVVPQVIEKLASAESLRLTGLGPARRALCIGINAYPAPNALQGCVADSDAWAGALSQLGFSVDKLQDSGASHANILNRLRAMVNSSRAGDTLVFQYAGHGTEVPDLDGDEPTVNGQPGEDQAICPVDFETGDLIIDDDIRAILDRLPAGVKLTCFLDSCHSGSATRLLVGRATGRPNARPRYVRLSQDVISRFVAKRRQVNQARALVGTRAGAGTREEMRWASFAACRDGESAWESDGHGDFTRLAVRLLGVGAGTTNADFQDQVFKAFGAARRQTPVLDCRDEDMASPFLLLPTDRSALPASSKVAPLQPQPSPFPLANDRARDVADVLSAIARLLR